MPCPFAWLSKVFPEIVPPHGMPLTDRSEGAAIALLTGTGLDWRTSLKELAGRHGITERYGREVVALPPVTNLTNEPLTLYVPYTPEIENHPVSYATATYLLHDDAAKNHEEIVAQIRMKLGPGAPGKAVTTLREEWRFGRIVIAATTWPPEKQFPGHRNLLESLPSLPMNGKSSKSLTLSVFHGRRLRPRYAGHLSQNPSGHFPPDDFSA
jgi:hypothetical protein